MSQHVCHPSYHRWGIKELGTEKAKMKEVRLMLMDRLTDPETRIRLSIAGVTLTGTPAQVGLIFDCLHKWIGTADIQGLEPQITTLRQCQAALKKARENADQFMLHDLDDPI